MWQSRSSNPLKTNVENGENKRGEARCISALRLWNPTVEESSSSLCQVIPMKVRQNFGSSHVYSSTLLTVASFKNGSPSCVCVCVCVCDCVFFCFVLFFCWVFHWHSVCERTTVNYTECRLPLTRCITDMARARSCHLFVMSNLAVANCLHLFLTFPLVEAHAHQRTPSCH